MVKVVGLADFRQFLVDLPEQLETKVLRNAVRAGAVVIADRARELCKDPKVKGSIKVSSRAERGLVSAKVKAVGPGAYRAPWAEYGTQPHLITANKLSSDGTTLRRKTILKINGKFAGKSVQHPGATDHPFMRPALDQGRAEALGAMSNYIRAHIAKHGITEAAPEADEE